MAIVDRATLKSYFETGDIPTQSQFVNLIDSLLSFLDDKIFGWQKVTINYDDFQPESNPELFIDCFSVPAGFQVGRIILILTTSFSGGTITDAFTDLYDPTDSSKYRSAFLNVFNAVTDVYGRVSPGYIDGFPFLIDISTGSVVRISIEVADATDGLNDLTQGALDVFFRLDKIPF